MKNPNSYAYRAPNPLESDDDDNDFDDNDDNPIFTPQNGSFYNRDDSKRHPKKRKLDSFVSNPPRGDVWTEDETFLLLEVWGDRFVELGRRSLRGEDWLDLSEKVSETSGVERTEKECRTQLDWLKNKYKKETAKVETGHASKWVFFKKMDALLNAVGFSRSRCGLGCGVDSGEYVFMNPRVYLERANVLDEMRDSPGQSEDEENEEDGEEEEEDGVSTRLLADSINKFGEIYEKIEEGKRKQMVELETMRQDFQREMELQKKQIVDRAQAEIAKIRELDDDGDEEEEEEEDDEDTSVENFGD